MTSRVPQRKNVRRRSNGSLLGMALLSMSIVIASMMFNKQSPQVSAEYMPPPRVTEFDEVKLPVPSHVVPAGKRIGDIQTKLVSFPRHQIPEGALREIGAFEDAVAVTALPAGLPFFAENLTLTNGPNNPVIERIPPGMRAMTVRVDATSSVEGWAAAGAVVDVLLIQDDKTNVVAEKVKIISAERSVTPMAGGEAPSIPSTVTLLVTQEQCLALNTAIPLGRIAFALRSNRDEESWASRSFSADRLRRGGISTDTELRISGYATVHDNGGVDRKEFALSGDKWIRTDVVPEGFFPAGQPR